MSDTSRKSGVLQVNGVELFIKNARLYSRQVLVKVLAEYSSSKLLGLHSSTLQSSTYRR